MAIHGTVRIVVYRFPPRDAFVSSFGAVRPNDSVDESVNPGSNHMYRSERSDGCQGTDDVTGPAMRFVSRSMGSS